MSKGARRRRQNGAEKVSPEVLHFSTTEPVQEEQKYELLFTVDEKEYFLWTNPPASVGLAYLKKVKTENPEAAAVWLLEQMIGEDGYQALTELPDLKDEDLEQIMKICKEYSTGDKEDGAKN